MCVQAGDLAPAAMIMTVAVDVIPYDSNGNDDG